MYYFAYLCGLLQERRFIEWSLHDDLADIDAVYMACTTSPRSHFWVLVECIEGQSQARMTLASSTSQGLTPAFVQGQKESKASEK
jgi:hypothetical protein